MHVAFRLVVGALLLVAALVVGCGHQPTETAPSRVETKDGPKGVVAGNIKVQRLRSEGEIAGSVEADAVRIGGRVRDRTVIRARSLEVTLSGKGTEVQFGDCELQVGDAPDKEAAIAAATAAAAPPEKASVPLPGVDPRMGEAQRKGSPSQMAWDEAAKAEAAAAASDEEPKRKRGTQPPPVG